jgi:hypothetical protein
MMASLRRRGHDTLFRGRFQRMLIALGGDFDRKARVILTGAG